MERMDERTRQERKHDGLIHGGDACKQRNYITVDILAPYRCENSKREHSVVNFQKYKLLQTRDTPGGGGEGEGNGITRL